jgi:hypothetical protein
MNSQFQLREEGRPVALTLALFSDFNFQIAQKM